jgi:hypothetical protein
MKKKQKERDLKMIHLRLKCRMEELIFNASAIAIPPSGPIPLTFVFLKLIFVFLVSFGVSGNETNKEKKKRFSKKIHYLQDSSVEWKS